MSYIAPRVTFSKFQADLEQRLPAHAWRTYCEGSYQVLRKKIAAKDAENRRELDRDGAVYRHMQKCANGGVQPKSTVKHYHAFSSLCGTRTAISYAAA